MARRRQNLGGGHGPTLKDIRDPVILLECSPCDRRDGFDRKTLVAQYGAGASLAKLRRRLAMGCEKICHQAGDLCEVRFPSIPGPQIDKTTATKQVPFIDGQQHADASSETT